MATKTKTTKPSKFDRISDNKIGKIGDILINALENCKTSSWKKPWLCSDFIIPASNLDYKKPYRGVNEFFLNLAVSSNGYRTPYFLTHNQIKNLGLHLNIVAYGKRGHKDENGKWVTSNETITIAEYEALSEEDRKQYYPQGENSLPVFTFYYDHYDEDHNKLSQSEYNDLTDEEKKQVKSYPKLTGRDEWNLDQTDFSTVYPDRYAQLIKSCTPTAKEIKQRQNASDPVLDYIFSGEKDSWRCPITHDGKNRAYYSPSTDSIHLPLRKHFFTTSSYYGTAIHECSHSNKKETKRDYKSTGFGSVGYATEELVAELSAAIMLHDLGIEKQIDDEHLVYVNDWKKVIKDKDIIRRILDDLMSSVNYNMRWYEKTKSLLASKTSVA